MGLAEPVPSKRTGLLAQVGHVSEKVKPLHPSPARSDNVNRLGYRNLNQTVIWIPSQPGWV